MFYNNKRIIDVEKENKNDFFGDNRVSFAGKSPIFSIFQIGSIWLPPPLSHYSLGYNQCSAISTRININMMAVSG